jgi:hypothetical protein
MDFPLAPGLAARIAALPPPVIVFNKSHSGSRLLAGLLRDQGLFMGSVLNESLDALPFLPLVEHLVLTYYPDFQGLWQQAQWPAGIQALLASALDAHLASHPPGTPWGWKLCESNFILPVLAAIFPQGRFVHLIRDGRDVAFSDHVAPESPFWRKIYFGTDQLRSWRGMALNQAAYERRRHLYNACHWQESVRVGRFYGAMRGPLYREIFYEQLCADLPAQGSTLLAWLGMQPDEAALVASAAQIDPRPIGKHRHHPRRQRLAVQSVVEPVLLACGYVCTPLPPSLADNSRAFLQRCQRAIKRRLLFSLAFVFAACLR